MKLSKTTMNFINSKPRRFLLLAMLVLPLLALAAASVNAQPEPASPLDTPEDPTKNTTLAQRLVRRETVFRDRLGDVPRQRITDRCKAAQEKITAFKERSFSVSDKREAVYKRLATRLDNIVNYLDGQGVDTTELVTAQDKFNQAINYYLADLQAYKAAVADLISVTCVSDPTGFHASLLEARELRVKLADGAADVKSTVPQLKSALQNARDALAAKNHTESESAL